MHRASSPRLWLPLLLIVAFLVQPVSWTSPAVPQAAVAQASLTPLDQGVYESCRLDLTEQSCLDRLSLIASTGFRFVLNYDVLAASAAQLQAYMSQAASLHVEIILALDNPVWWNGTQSARSTYPALAASCAADASSAPCATDGAFLDYILRQVSSSAALWGYYVGDEVRDQDFPSLKRFTDSIRAVDPAHPRLFVAGNPAGIATVNTDLVRLTSEPDYATATVATTIAQNYYPVGSWPQVPVNGAAIVAPQLETVSRNNRTNNGITTHYAMVLQAHSFLPYVPEGYGCGNPPSLSVCPYPTIAQMQTMLSSSQTASNPPQFVLWYSFFDLYRSGYFDYHWSNLVTAAGLNLVRNPSFDAPWFSPWAWRSGASGSSASGSASQECRSTSSPADSSCLAHVQVTGADPAHASAVGFSQGGVALTAGRQTVLSFDAQSPNGGMLSATLTNAAGTASYFAATPALTASWTHYRYAFTDSQASDSNAVLSLDFGGQLGDVYLGDVTVTTPAQ